jgi:hypothetical protein
VSGPFTVNVFKSFEFTTEIDPTVVQPPYVLNVFSNLNKEIPFEGYANIRSNCPADTLLQIDAGYEMVNPIQTSPTAPPALLRVIKSITVVKPTGNAGE